MQEVHALPVDLGDELRERVQSRFLGAPVKPLAPVADEVAGVAERHAVRPPGVRQLVRPAHVRETLLQVVEIGLWDLGVKWHGLGGRHESPSRSERTGIFRSGLYRRCPADATGRSTLFRHNGPS
jgi:hypothetical protein